MIDNQSMIPNEEAELAVPSTKYHPSHNLNWQYSKPKSCSIKVPNEMANLNVPIARYHPS
jgi:hypothetical protein